MPHPGISDDDFWKAFEAGSTARKNGAARAAPYSSEPHRRAWYEGWDAADTVLQKMEANPK